MSLRLIQDEYQLVRVQKSVADLAKQDYRKITVLNMRLQRALDGCA